jgi:hypothetical protein
VTGGGYIYDLIPLTHPEYCDAHLVSDFALSLGDGLAVFDFVLTISEYTAQEVKRMQRRHNLPFVPVQAVPLAHVLKGDVVPNGQSFWTSNIAALRDRPFVMMVCTIESRKNHAYLVSAWKFFLEEDLDPPDLVFVGRYGWRVTDFMEQLEASDFLGGRIHVLHDLSDGELETLYRNCLFTAFPSFVEGWGLPVGESLAYGCPCVASSTTSIPEVGGDLVDYVDPYNLRAGVEVLRRMAFDADYRTRRRKQISAGFKARKWDEVTDDLLTKVNALRQAGTRDISPPLLRAGELFVPRDLLLGHQIPTNYLARPLRLILTEGWYPTEKACVWMRNTRGALEFLTEYSEGTGVVVYLNMCGPPWSIDEHLRIRVGSGTGTALTPEFPRSVARNDQIYPVAPGGPLLCRAVGKVGAKGIVEINLTVSGKGRIPAEEPRNFFVGLLSLAYCASSDIDMRADIAETFMMAAIKAII